MSSDQNSLFPGHTFAPKDEVPQRAPIGSEWIGSNPDVPSVMRKNGEPVSSEMEEEATRNLNDARKVYVAIDPASVSSCFRKAVAANITSGDNNIH